LDSLLTYLYWYNNIYERVVVYDRDWFDPPNTNPWINSAGVGLSCSSSFLLFGMSTITQKIGQSVLDNVIRFKDLITNSALAVGIKFTFEASASAALLARRASDKSPLRFVFRNTTSQALVQISSFDFHSFLFNGKKFDEYFVLYPAEDVDTQIAPHFTVNSIKHQLIDGTFVDELTPDTIDEPKYRYPLYYYNGYSVYMTKRNELLKAAANKDDFRMPAKHIEKCRKSGIPSTSLGFHFKQLDLDCPLLEVDEVQAKAFNDKHNA
jgi:hypothetical protein